MAGPAAPPSVLPPIHRAEFSSDLRWGLMRHSPRGMRGRRLTRGPVFQTWLITLLLIISCWAIARLDFVSTFEHCHTG